MRMSPNSEVYKLRWGDFESNLSGSLLELRSSQDFYDVTVSLNEGQFLQGHKFVLAASSSYFQTLLRRQSASSSVVLLLPPNVKMKDLKALFDFMYTGQVSIVPEELESFMNLANYLKIKGLSAVSSSSSSSSSSKQSKIPKFPPSISVQVPSSKHSNKRLKSSSVGEGEESPGFSRAIELPTPSKLMGLICPGCGIVFHGVQLLKDHMVSCYNSISTFNSVFCNICDKPFKNEKNMLGHQKRIHKVDGTYNTECKSLSTEHPLQAHQQQQQLQAQQQLYKRRGRPCKKPTETEMNLSHGSEDYLHYVETPLQSSLNFKEPIRPVGQVPPAPRSNETRTKGLPNSSSVRIRGPLIKNPSSSSSSSGSGSGGVSGSASGGASGKNNMDLQKLGLKFGGQISITSSEAPRRLGDGSSEGVSITKLKGEHSGSSLGASFLLRRSETVEVKVEPSYEEEEEDEEEEEHYGEEEEGEREEVYGEEFEEEEEEIGDGFEDGGGGGHYEDGGGGGVSYGHDEEDEEEEDEEEEEEEDEESYSKRN